MIERKFIIENLKEFKVKEYVREQVKRAGISKVNVQKTPLGEKITISTPRPGLVVGRKGQNIRDLTADLKQKFAMENPKIEIEEVPDVNLDPHVVADKISNSLERYGLNRFKAIGHKTLEGTMRAGARGVEILISGKVPSSRSRTWRFYAGYMKKSGEFNKRGVLKAHTHANMKTGIVGIQVRIMPPDAKLPDALKMKTQVEEVAQEPKTSSKEKKPVQKEKKVSSAKKQGKKTTTQKKDDAAAEKEAVKTAAKKSENEKGAEQTAPKETVKEEKVNDETQRTEKPGSESTGKEA